MTNKVQKILSEITTRKLCTMDEHMAFYNDKAKEDYRLLSEIEEIIKALQEEPVSEDLEYASEKYACRFSSSKYGHDKVKDAFIAGDKWKEEQLMKDAVDVEVKIDAGGYPYIPQIELWDYDKDEPLAEEGDKVKVIVIKED